VTRTPCSGDPASTTYSPAPSPQAHGPDDTERSPAITDDDPVDGIGAHSREAVLDALQAHRWKKARTAEALGLSRHQLKRLMEKLKLRDLDPNADPDPEPDANA
jgi:transcriptional regulator with GAF, ATPase, and Fis domain